MNLVIIHWRILSYLFLIPLFLFVSIILTVMNVVSTVFCDIRIGRINAGTFGAAMTFHWSGVCESSLPLSSSIPNWLSASQSSSLSFESYRSPLQLSQLSVSEMLSGDILSSLSAGGRSIRLIPQTFSIWVHPPGRSFADKAGGKGDFSYNLNAAAPSCWNSDQDASTISSRSEMYPAAVTCVFWAQDSFCGALGFWLPCKRSKKSWTLAIQCNFLCSASLFISISLSALVGCNSGSSAASNLVFARTNCLTTTVLCNVPPVVFDCLYLITSRPRETLGSTPTPWGMIENISRARLQKSSYLECDSWSCRHQSVISGIQNVLLNLIGSES